MTKAFSHDDVFPVIARVIVEQHLQTRDYVSHAELVTGLLDDPLGRQMIEAAVQSDNHQKDARWWASNMVQWFSKRFTDGTLPLLKEFERREDATGWSYRPTVAH